VETRGYERVAAQDESPAEERQPSAIRLRPEKRDGVCARGGHALGVLAMLAPARGLGDPHRIRAGNPLERVGERAIASLLGTTRAILRATIAGRGVEQEHGLALRARAPRRAGGTGAADKLRITRFPRAQRDERIPAVAAITV
jgi:hypothetical protein